MASLKLPKAGLHIDHEHAPANEPRHIIYLDSKTQKSQGLREIFKAIKNNERVRLRTGPKPTIEAGKKSISLAHAPSQFKRELFSGALSGSEPVYFAGQLNDCLKVLAPAEHALDTLKSNLKTARDERIGSKDGLALKKDNRPSSSLFTKDRLLPTSTPGSPFIGSAISPQQRPTSQPFAAISHEEKVRQEAIKIPLIHLLATEPQSSRALAAKVGIEQDECDKLLGRWAQDARKGPGKKELRDRVYKELDVWKFKFYTQADRQAAIDHAVSAFDRLRIDKHDKIWQMLLAPEDRGKNIFLSRLNFDKPIPAGNLTPRVPERSTDGSTEGKSMTSEADDKNRKAKAVQAVNELLGKKKKQKEPEKKPLAEKPVGKTGAATTKEVKKPASQAPKQESKFKSSERIIDSDEEANDPTTITVAVKTAPRKQHLVAPKASQQASKPANATNTALHKAQSSSSSVEIDKQLNSTKMAKTRSGIDTTKHKPAAARVDNTALKTSPFGSSPPTNSTDADASSSGKISSQSSAISSPPSSTELNEVRRNSKFSPSILAAKPTKPAEGGIKRKADTKHDETATKRQQVNGTHVNGLPKALNVEVEKGRGALRRDSPASDALTSPDKTAKNRQDVIDDAKEFLRCHAKYKDLHESLNKKKSADRTDKDMDKIWRMHKRLEQWKNELWRDWDLVGSESAR